MNRFTFKMLGLGRTLLMLTAVIAVGLAGCGGDDNPNDNGGNNNGGNNTGGNNNNSGGSSGGLVLGNNEAWVTSYDYAGETQWVAWVFKNDGKRYSGNKVGNGDWKFSGEYETYSTSGNKLTFNSGTTHENSMTYSISGNKLTITEEAESETYSSTLTKTSGLNIVIPSGSGNYDVSLSCGNRPCKTVAIGGKTWMAENLNYKMENSWCYGDGAPACTGSGENICTPGGSKTLSASEIQANCDTYGRLYTEEAAKTACPKGWRLPRYLEYGDLATAAGGTDRAGYVLKSTSGWSGYNNNGNDSLGFSALPGGSRNGPLGDGSYSTYEYIGSYGYWWTLGGSVAEISHGDKLHWYSGRGAFSVRCIKD